MKLLAEMGFEAPIKRPTKKTEKELKDMMVAYIVNNDRSALTSRIEGILYLLEHGKYKHILDPGSQEFAYRFIDTKNVYQMREILRVPFLEPSGTPYKIGGGILVPDDRGISSWTTNPRSLVYSGFFSVLPEDSHLALVRARIKENKFFGNPDSMALSVGLPEDYYAPGYALEREVVGVGPISYDEGYFVARRRERSLEGQAMDLIDRLVPISSMEKEDWTEDYYFPDGVDFRP